MRGAPYTSWGHRISRIREHGGKGGFGQYLKNAWLGLSGRTRRETPMIVLSHLYKLKKWHSTANLFGIPDFKRNHGYQQMAVAEHIRKQTCFDIDATADLVYDYARGSVKWKTMV